MECWPSLRSCGGEVTALWWKQCQGFLCKQHDDTGDEAREDRPAVLESALVLVVHDQHAEEDT